MSLETSRNKSMSSQEFHSNQIDTQGIQSDQPKDTSLNRDASEWLDLGVNKDIDSGLDPHSSELYNFGDEDYLLTALNEDPSWNAVTQLLGETPSLTAEVITPRSKKEVEADSTTPPPQNENDMELMDDDFDLPELPNILNVFNTQQQDNSVQHNLDKDDGVNLFHMGDTQNDDIPSPMMIDSGMVPRDMPSITLTDSTYLPGTRGNLSKDVFSKRMEALGLDDNSVIVISSSATTPTSATTPASATTPTSATTPSYTIASSSRPSPSPASISSSTRTSETPQPPGLRVTLRKRRAIQLKPFTLESAHFQKLLARAPAKSKLSDIGNIRPNIDDDDSDIDFTPTDTQGIDEGMDEILSTQDALDDSISSEPRQTVKKKMNKKPSLPQENASHPPPQTASLSVAQTKKSYIVKLTQASTSTVLPVASSSRPQLEGLSSRARSSTPSSEISENIIYSQDLQKYGLDQLILPPTRKGKEKAKPKVITFASKKKGSRKKSTRTTSRVPSSRFSQPITKDIFAFDLDPKASFSHQPIVIHDSDSRSSAANEDDTNSTTSDIAATSSPTRQELNINDDDDDMDEDEEIIIRRRPAKRRRHTEFDSDDGEDGDVSDIAEEEEKLNEDQLNAIYNFPPSSEELPHTRRHLKNAAAAEKTPQPRRLMKPASARREDDIIPIVDDEFEYRENKRQRMGIKDLKKKALKSVLPASFVKIYEKELLEEQRQRNQARKRSAPTKKASESLTSPSTSSPSITNHNRDADDVFAAFRESQSDDSDDGFDRDDNGFDDYDNFFDDDGGFDDTTTDSVSNNTAAEIDNVSRSNNPQVLDSRQNMQNAQPPIAPIFQNIRLSGSSRSNTETARPTSSLHPNSSHIPTPVPNYQSPYPLEATEDNRFPRQHVRSSGGVGNSDNRNYRPTNSRPRARRPATKSSIAIVRPANANARYRNLIRINNNPTPLRRRKMPKRSTDDIYVHAPYFTGHWGNYKSKNGDQGRMIYYDGLPRRAFDDIFMGTKRQTLWYKNHSIYIGNYNIDDYLMAPPDEMEEPQQFTPVIYSLQSVIKRVRGLFDHDLRRVMGLKNTVYLHHCLLQPLLSATPNKSIAYARFKDSYSDLRLFGRVYFWSQIVPKQKTILDQFFAKVFQDLSSHMCANDRHNPQPNLEEEIADHDHFYVFVSICLTQWIPCLSYEDQVQLTELFANYIRGLAYMVIKLVEVHAENVLPWRSLVKVILFILDWTCRLHHLGIGRSIWSVTECTQLIMDTLVFIGYNDIQAKSETKHYIVEAWICIIQIMSVSTRDGGYFLNEQVFLNQLTDAIKRKSKDAGTYEFEKRKTTRIWAENLNFILDEYIMLL